MKNDKCPGPDNILGEFLKLIEEEDISWVTKLFKRIYVFGVISHIWLKATFVTSSN